MSIRGVALVLVLAFNITAARGQDIWQMVPYQVHAEVIFGNDPALTPAFQQQVLRQLHQQTANVIGARWNFEAAAADATWKQAGGPDLRASDEEALVQLALELQDERQAVGVIEAIDKIFVVSIGRGQTSWQIAVRELDVVTRTLGEAVHHPAAQRELISQTAFDSMLDAFSPLALIQEGESNDVRLAMRGAGIPMRDSRLRFTEPGDLFIPIIRQNNRDGTPRGIRAVPWTYLRVVQPEQPADAPVRGNSPPRDELEFGTETFSALRSAFTNRRRGREEKYALQVHVRHPRTILRAVDNKDPDNPLPGYEVISYTPDSPVTSRLGITDGNGEIVVSADQAPLHLLLVRSGDQLLARLPIVPGARPVAEIALGDDRARLEIEGFIAGLQEEIVSAFTKREILGRFILERASDNRVDEARLLFERLRALPTDQSFRNRIRARRESFFVNDPSIQRRVDKLFEDTLGVLDRYYGTDRIREFQQAIDDAAASGSVE